MACKLGDRNNLKKRKEKIEKCGFFKGGIEPRKREEKRGRYAR